MLAESSPLAVAEYDLDFGAKLASIANEVDEADPWAYDARRVTIYLSRLSAEICLKALLEKAGMPISKIKSRSHNLRALLNDMGECEVYVEIAPGVKRWCPASRVREALRGEGRRNFQTRWKTPRIFQLRTLASI